MRFLLLLILLSCASLVRAEPIHIVAAENIYGSVAKQIGGDYVVVYNIINNPNQDPHLFNASHETAKSLAKADIVVANGAGYDAWIDRLVSVNTKNPIQWIVIAQLLHKENVKSKPVNPHFWYDPATMLIYAKALAKVLSQHDPSHQTYYLRQLRKFTQEYQSVIHAIEKIKANYKNTVVIATEPIFNYMVKALGMQMLGENFQINIMNDIEPTVMQVKSFENDLRQHAATVLIYNQQVTNPHTRYMEALAKKLGIPVVGVAEMLPPEKTYVQWIQDELNQLEQALRVQHHLQ